MVKTSDTAPRPLQVGIISLGCAKNLVDSEVMLGSLVASGLEITNDAAQADVVIVNTCSFIDAAQEESVEAILASAEVREANNRGQGLIVSGCLPQRFREELPKLLPEVDAFMGIDQVAQVADIVHEAFRHRARKLSQGKGTPGRSSRRSAILPELAAIEQTTSRPSPGPEAPLTLVNPRPTYIPDYNTPRFRLTPGHFAYLKIAEGCNHPCSFCIIPQMRGSHRSRPLADIVAEARALIESGVKEINLISQDSTYYGLDLRPSRRGSIAAPHRFQEAAQNLPPDTPTLSTLLRELNALPGDFWIRLLYTHPAHWTDDLIHTVAECPKVARYVDMPLQHIHDNMLERMRRETSEAYIRDLIRKIRQGIPGIALRTTFIVGFPGETDACFQALLDFIQETRFERLGVFTYSNEEGTRAAKMLNQIPAGEKKRRRNRLMAVQREIAREIAGSFVGRELKVLVEKQAGPDDLENTLPVVREHGDSRRHSRAATRLPEKFLVARGEADAPDIDGRILIRGDLPIGQFAKVRIVDHTDYDLIAEPSNNQ